MLLSIIVFSSTADRTAGAVGGGKIAPEVLADTTAGGKSTVVVLLAEQADVSAAYGITDQDARGWFVYNTLTSHAARTQAPLHAFLAAQNISHQSFWAANIMVATADRAQIEAIAARDDVARIDSNRAARWIEEPEVAKFGVTTEEVETTSTIEWGVSNVNAPAVWALGFTGTGIVVGSLDTGVRWTHSALKLKYRGWNGVAADHNFNWHDAVHSDGGTCGPDTVEPCDDDVGNSHGTHVAGSMVGDDGVANQIGVAPGAKWIACRNMDQGSGTPATYTECLQFMIAPTDLSGNNANPALRPHVLNNSWECASSEGCTTGAELEMIINNAQAAGIFVTGAAGNSGPACSTVSGPPAIYNATFSVGAYDMSNLLAGFSSRGPSTFNNPNLLKPNLSAPGVVVRSSKRTNDTAFGILSGTSMAAPHVSGVVALLWSARPDLVRNISATKELLQRTANPAVTVSPAQTCGGTTSTQIPNNSFGYGRVDALAALNGNFLVTTLLDTNNGGCGATCSLRDAITAANNAPGGGHVISFAPALQGTIQLAGALPSLTRNVTLKGPGADVLTVQRTSGGDYRIFTINPAVVVSISGLTISNGKGGTAGGGILNDHGNVTVSRCVLLGNTAGNGGGIVNDGSVSGSAIATLESCTLRNNSVTSFGGAIFNSGANGGAGTLYLRNCTLADNSAGSRGAAIHNTGASGDASVPIFSCTFSGNSAPLGGIFNTGISGNALMTLRNSIFKTGASGGNFSNSSGTILSDGHNISNDAAGGDAGTGPGGILNGAGDSRNTDPRLDPAGPSNNGGPTSTIALLSISPAINAADGLAPTLDQRGFVRAGSSDIGAFEFGGSALRITSITRLTNGHVLLQAHGVPNAAHTIEATPDLRPNSFEALLNSATADGTGALQFDDAGAVGLTKRFYRLTFP